MFMKGALEKVLTQCTHTLQANTPVPITSQHTQEIIQQSRDMGSRGLRVVAVATGVDLGKLTLLGLLGIHDPPRPGVKSAIDVLKRSGVRVKMLTGDAEETAVAIGERLFSSRLSCYHLFLYTHCKRDCEAKLCWSE